VIFWCNKVLLHLARATRPTLGLSQPSGGGGAWLRAGGGDRIRSSGATSGGRGARPWAVDGGHRRIRGRRPEVVATTVVVDHGRRHGTRTNYRKQSIFGGFEYFWRFIWVVENIESFLAANLGLLKI
jgi:hypothetical protein